MSTSYDMNKDIPSSFSQDDEYLDKKENYGLTLPRHVISSQWSKEKDIHGRDIRTIRVIDMCYKGIENYALRTIANGRYTSIEITRNIK